MMALDVLSVQAFLLVAELQSFTRTAEALGTTQAAISMKLQRLEAILGKRLFERSPRSVRLTADGLVFREKARLLIEAHDNALYGTKTVRQLLRLGISDHAAGPELVQVLKHLRGIASSLTLSVAVDFSRVLMDAFDAGSLDAIIVRQESRRRGGEALCTDEFGWFASPAFEWRTGDPLPIATLAPPCGVRATAIRALDKANIKWTEAFVGGGVSAVAAAAAAGIGIAPLAKRIAPMGMIDMGPTFKLPKLGSSKVILHSQVSDATKLGALRMLAAAFRKVAAP